MLRPGSGRTWRSGLQAFSAHSTGWWPSSATWADSPRRPPGHSLAESAGSNVGPSPNQVVVMSCQIDEGGMVGNIGGETLNGRIERVEHLPAAAIADHALDPEEARQAHPRADRQHAVYRRAGIQQQVARAQFEIHVDPRRLLHQEFSA